MGSNGQQLLVELPPGSGKVQIIGKNQFDKSATWHGNSHNAPGGNGNYGVFTSNWWWKEKIEIWWDNSDKKTEFFTVDVPIVQNSDVFIVSPPGYTPPPEMGPPTTE